MSPKSKISSTLLLALLFSYLFYKQSLGINFLIFEFCALALLFIFKQIDLTNPKIKFALAGFGISIISFVWNFSAFAFIVNLLFSIYFIGILSYPLLKNHFNSFFFGISSMFLSIFKFIKCLNSSAKSRNSAIKKIWKTKIYLIPISIILIFVTIYRNSNPYFNSIVISFEKYTINKIPNLFEYIDENWLFLFVVGTLLSSFIIFRSTLADLVQYDRNSKDQIIRARKRMHFDSKPNALHTEAKLGVLLLFILNGILMVLNSIDIYWVWFNFKWDGTILKQFVHEGTYLLIFSILLSIVIVLYYFRANQNFNPKIKRLKTLSYLWIAQNIILCISVGIRNYWYIDYFNLAYKRIGVIIFLLITIYGLYTVYLKLKHKKSFGYLLSKNTYSILFILLFFSLFNWDVLIAKYNFRNANKAFLHLDYMQTLGDKALPYLEKSLYELTSIKQQQQVIFRFDTVYLSAEEYVNSINNRKTEFLKKDENIDWRSWNYSEYKAKKMLLATE
jgi:hypothetical protein